MGLLNPPLGHRTLRAWELLYLYAVGKLIVIKAKKSKLKMLT